MSNKLFRNKCIQSKDHLEKKLGHFCIDLERIYDHYYKIEQYTIIVQ